MPPLPAAPPPPRAAAANAPRAANALLFRAAASGDTCQLREALRQGADPRLSGQDGLTAVHEAAKRGRARAVAMLCERGALPLAADATGRQPIHLAAAEGHREVVALLLDRWPVAADARTRARATPLHYACRGGHAAVEHLLLDRKADGRATTSAGQTPIALARDHGHATIVELLRARALGGGDGGGGGGDDAGVRAAGALSASAGVAARAARARVRGEVIDVTGDEAAGASSRADEAAAAGSSADAAGARFAAPPLFRPGELVLYSKKGGRPREVEIVSATEDEYLVRAAAPGGGGEARATWSTVERYLRMAPAWAEGDVLEYRRRAAGVAADADAPAVRVTVLEVHRGDQRPFYTVRMPDGLEKQTVDQHLKRPALEAAGDPDLGEDVGARPSKRPKPSRAGACT